MMVTVHQSDIRQREHQRRSCRNSGQNIRSLLGQVPKSVEVAMLGIASAEPHPDLQGALKKIKQGAKKAPAWLKDKVEDTKCTLPALINPIVSSLLRSAGPLNLQRTAMSKHTGISTATVSVSHCWQ